MYTPNLDETKKTTKEYGDAHMIYERPDEDDGDYGGGASSESDFMLVM